MFNFGQVYTWGRPTYPYLKCHCEHVFQPILIDRAELQSVFHFYLSRQRLQTKTKNDWCIFECIVSLTCSAIFAGVPTFRYFFKSQFVFILKCVKLPFRLYIFAVQIRHN